MANPSLGPAAKARPVRRAVAHPRLGESGKVKISVRMTKSDDTKVITKKL
jgi:hypothetical protein